jgi:hypothetical protein
MMLNRVARNFGYDPPISRIETRHERHICFVDFYLTGGEVKWISEQLVRFPCFKC